MTFPRYEQYKDSGVEWLAEVPKHWDVISIKWLSPVKRGASPRPIDDPKYFDDDGEYSWVRIADVSASDGSLVETTQRLSDLGSSLSVKVAPGDLFVSIAGTVGKPCITAIKACIHDGFVYFPTLKLPPHFLYRIFESGTCYGGLGKMGTQLNLNTDTIGSIRVALPPAPEIQELLTFLDHETAKIDALIAEQQRLIELLKEKRQAVISQAVAKGMDPGVPMKDSGVEWLGEVPEHWEVGPLKRHWSVTDCKHITADFVEEGVPLASIREVQGWTVDLSGAKQTTEHYFRQLIDGGRTPLPEDIIFTRNATVGEAALVPENGPTFAMGQDVCLLRRLDNKQASAFMLHQIKSAVVKVQLDNIMIGSTFKRINVEDIRNLVFCFPPPDEQHQIAAHLALAVQRFDDLLNEACAATALLQERRTALISAAVTGKIDVRGHAPKFKP